MGSIEGAMINEAIFFGILSQVDGFMVFGSMACDKWGGVCGYFLSQGCLLIGFLGILAIIDE
ncbi:hypothetical protein SAMN02745725_03102 [Pseudobutyrivibrio xylanivorans DSM 14809]|uniref:Uncharacterized protein n=2 Tax=Pseudobutyrivibrio xylanivorans TaxID=185007 RepID=A0A1M6LG71_PSEXY|nr:hypothetical protein SAMN02745725_03102 [Pseudobutyrivibrio xylanivorans DSM 14809]